MQVLDPSPDGAQHELAGRLRLSGEPDRFEFHHRAAGSTLLNCFLPNREFWGALDYRSGVLLLRSTTTGTPIAMVTDRRAVLHQSLFGAGAELTTWVQLERPAKPTARPVLTRVLGVDLAGYVLGDALPPSGRATALAALDVAREVNRIGSQSIGTVQADGYQISVNAEKFIQEASPSSTVASDEAARTPVPNFEVWLGSDNTVVRIVVQPRDVDRDPKEADTSGWAIDYLPGEPVAFKDAGDVTAFDALEPSTLAAPAAAGCNLPS